MPSNATTKTAAQIDDDAYEARTHDHGRLSAVNAATATESLVIAREVVSQKTEGAIAVETDAQNLPNTAPVEGPQRIVEQILTKIGDIAIHHLKELRKSPTPQTQTQTIL